MDFEVTPDQIDDTAKMLIQEISMFNLADITLLFNRIKKGHYGVFYGKFNPQLILVAAKEYRMERGRILSRLTTEEQEQILK